MSKKLKRRPPPPRPSNQNWALIGTGMGIMGLAAIGLIVWIIMRPKPTELADNTPAPTPAPVKVRPQPQPEPEPTKPTPSPEPVNNVPEPEKKEPEKREPEKREPEKREVKPEPEATSPGKTEPEPAPVKSGPSPDSLPVGIEVNNRVVEIEGVDLQNKKFKLSDYKGKVVLLDFWGFW